MIKLRRAKRVPRTPDARMPMLDHLGELRNRIIVSFVAVLIGATIAFVFSNDVIEFLVTFYQRALGNDHAKLVNLSPVDGFVIRLKVATYGGIVLALPVWLYA
jgi:sec-independent protein translocase protein TatC